MRLDFLQGLSRHCSGLADWLSQQAEALETGEDRHFHGDRDISEALAQDFRHRANNIQALLMAMARIAERQERDAASASAVERAPMTALRADPNGTGAAE
jgi:hypothetical protein